MGKSTEGATSRLAAAVVRPPGLESAVRERARLLLCDYLGVAASGAGAASSASARRIDGIRPGSALVEGTSARFDAADAILLNGLAAHALELDDTHEPGSLHPGVVIWPVVLGLADEMGASADAVLDAAAIGYDVMCTLGEMLGGAAAYNRGFHPTGVVGTFGAAAAAGRLVGLTHEQARCALGIAGTTASGSLEYLSDGAWTKRLNPAVAGVNGLRAARLARTGFSGPATAVEGAHGFLRGYGDADSPGRADLPLVAGSGILSTSVKFYACCRYLHGIIDLLTDLSDQHDLRTADVESIGCGVLSGGGTLVAEPIEAKRSIRSEVDAQFSAPFVAAVAVARRKVQLTDFRRGPIVARELQDLLDRVECFTSPRLDAAYPKRWGAEVWVRLRGGATVSAEESSFRGSPDAPPSWENIAAKLRPLVGSAADELVAQCQQFGGTGPASAVLPVRRELRDATS